MTTAKINVNPINASNNIDPVFADEEVQRFDADSYKEKYGDRWKKLATTVRDVVQPDGTIIREYVIEDPSLLDQLSDDEDNIKSNIMSNIQNSSSISSANGHEQSQLNNRGHDDYEKKLNNNLDSLANVLNNKKVNSNNNNNTKFNTVGNSSSYDLQLLNNQNANHHQSANHTIHNFEHQNGSFNININSSNSNKQNEMNNLDDKNEIRLNKYFQPIHSNITSPTNTLLKNNNRNNNSNNNNNNLFGSSASKSLNLPSTNTTQTGKSVKDEEFDKEVEIIHEQGSLFEFIILKNLIFVLVYSKVMEFFFYF